MSLLNDLIYLDLSETTEKTIVEYIWIGGSGMDLRSKARTVSGPVTDPSQLPKWNYDGSSTGQAPGEDSEVILYPQAIFPDPFRRGNHILGPYYCPIGADKAFGRDIVDAHYKACIYAGINIGGINGEVMPGQWEYQVGPSVGISAGDQVWVSRYILERITEIAGVVVSFDPKPIPGDWNGAGAHTHYSTKSMRSDRAFEVIKAAIDKLGHETADINTFLWGVTNRGASIRVGRDTEKAGKGYFEDRNMDPYVVTSMIAETTILWKL
ncbi:unnamed protein product [Fraxinus pennsylvanica]|uniref:Glutamine synthetase n=1 Tax=Fraxinus pennsylvanica TaxID=56036 RepID=A0AAD2E7D6_9LAMI|nr:unnamed protein product [Fraxinus pennsylvanica]